MPGVSRDNDTAEGDLIPSQTTVYANNNLIIIDNDQVEPHAPGGIHGPPPPTIPAGVNANVYVANKRAIVASDSATCGHKSTGSGNVIFYDSGIVPQISIPAELAVALDRANNQSIANPPAVGDTGEQVTPSYAPTPEAGVDALGSGSLIDPQLSATTASASNIPGFLSQILAEAAQGNWDEKNNSNNNPSISNPNIIGIWRELGIGRTGMWANDQTPWCAGFANWVLKRTGYRYMQSARAYDFRDKVSVYGGVQVPINQAQPGDIVVWDYSHVNFLYSITSNGGYTFVGGNQSDTASATNNNPSGGTVNNSWKSGWKPNRGRISGIYRPSRS